MKTEIYDLEAAVTKKSTTIKTSGIFYSSTQHLTTNPNASGPRPQQQIYNKTADLNRYFTVFSSGNMEATTTHINLIDDEDEKDPLALDTSSGERSSTEDSLGSAPSTSKHSHSLRRHVPRIIVKPILPDKKLTSVGSSGANASGGSPSSTSSSSTASVQVNCSPSTGRTSSSRRIQQQQQAKQAAAAAAAAAASAATNTTTTAITQASTMREVLASIPGFSLKPRRRSSKKISTAAQIEQTKDGKIDLETPDSILASTNLRALLNKQTFSLLPPLYQYNLIQLLPSVDRETIEMEQKCAANTIPTEAIRLGPSSLNNEFFARACLEWRERLGEGEFTPENQMKLRTEAEREKNKLDPWKLKHFEPIWGEKSFNRASSSRTTTTTTASATDVCINNKVKLEVLTDEKETTSKTATCTIVVTQTTTISTTATTTATAASTAITKTDIVDATSSTTQTTGTTVAITSASNYTKTEALSSNSPMCSLNSSATNSSTSCSLDNLTTGDTLTEKHHVTSSPKQHNDNIKQEEDDDDVECIEMTITPTSTASSLNKITLKQENYDKKTESKQENFKKEIDDDRILQDLPTSSANAIKLIQESQRRGTKRPSNSPTNNNDFVEEPNESNVATGIASTTKENESSNLKENVPTEVNSLNSSSDDVICLDGPTNSKKLKIEKAETNSNNSVCQIDAGNNVEENAIVAPPNQNTPQYLDEQNNTKSMITSLTMNKQQEQYVVNNFSNSNSNSNSATNSRSSTSPPPASTLSATISTVNSTCDTNLPYTIDLMGSNETKNIRDHQQQLQQQQQQDQIYTHTSPEIESEHQQHQQETMILTNSMQLDNCNNQLLHHPYSNNNNNNNNNMDEDEDDVIEQKFNDAENYVLESGEVSTDGSGNDSKHAKITNFHCVTTTTATTHVVTTTPTTNTECVVNSADFLFTNSLDQGKLIYGLKPFVN